MAPADGATLRIGVDLGGTKIEAVVGRLTGDRIEVLARRRIATDRDLGYDHVVDATATLVRDVGKDSGLAALPPIGVGMPGSVTFRSPDGAPSDVALVKNSNTTCLNGRPFRRDLEARLGATITFGNDADCFALAETTLGAARDARVAFGVILGTGVGGGIAVRDAFSASGRARTWAGAQGIAGEWGHVAIEPRDGPACYCGKRGCVETLLSGPAIERRYAGKSGTSRSLREIAERATTDDLHASATIAEACETFGRALSFVVNVVDPDVVVLGGGVSNVDALYTDGVSALGRWIFNDALRTRVVPNALGDSAGVFGAALLPDTTT